MNYDIAYSYKWFTIAPVFWGFLGLFVVGVYLILNVKNPYVIKKVPHLIASLIWLVISGFLIVNLMIHSLTVYRHVYLPYTNGEYEIVEGEVQDFDPASYEYIISLGADQFMVEGITFSVGNLELAGLRKNAANGGPIYIEGQRVVIYYIPLYGKNYIVRIDVLVED